MVENAKDLCPRLKLKQNVWICCDDFVLRSIQMKTFVDKQIIENYI